MVKSFKDAVQDSPGTGLGIPVKTKKPLSRANGGPGTDEECVLCMVVEGTCSDGGRIKQFRIYHAPHQPSLSFPGTTNVGHEPSQSGSTLDDFGSRDLQVFAGGKPSIQLYTQVPNALVPLDFTFPENDPRVFEGSSVCDQQSLSLFRGHF